jgi:hypothetical protein
VRALLASLLEFSFTSSGQVQSASRTKLVMISLDLAQKLLGGGTRVANREGRVSEGGNLEPIYSDERRRISVNLQTTCRPVALLHWAVPTMSRVQWQSGPLPGIEPRNPRSQGVLLPSCATYQSL